MEFAERYSRALARAAGRDEAALMAAAFAATDGQGAIGALLWRVKALGGADGADGAAHAAHAAHAARAAPAGPRADPRAGPELAQLLGLWRAEVTRQGRARRWMAEETPWDARAAQHLYRTVAEQSLAHWLAPGCPACVGSGRDGAGAAPPCRGGFLRERVLDMVSELQCIADRHARRAGRRLARA